MLITVLKMVAKRAEKLAEKKVILAVRTVDFMQRLDDYVTKIRLKATEHKEKLYKEARLLTRISNSIGAVLEDPENLEENSSPTEWFQDERCGCGCEDPDYMRELDEEYERDFGPGEPLKEIERDYPNDTANTYNELKCSDCGGCEEPCEDTKIGGTD